MGTREAYARAYYSNGDIEVTVGIELRETDENHVDGLTTFALNIAAQAVISRGLNHMSVCRCIEREITANCPGRAYFIETERVGKGVQVFQPFGLPRTQPKERTGCLLDKCGICGTLDED